MRRFLTTHCVTQSSSKHVCLCFSRRNDGISGNNGFQCPSQALRNDGKVIWAPIAEATK